MKSFPYKLWATMFIILSMFVVLFFSDKPVNGFSIVFTPSLEANHENITSEGLAFLKNNVVESVFEKGGPIPGIIDAHYLVDPFSLASPTLGHSFSYYHFDGCQFSWSTWNIKAYSKK